MTTSNKPSSDEVELRAVIDAWANALRTKDVEGVFAQHAPALVQFALAPPLRNAGATALDRKFYEKWFASFVGPIGYEICDLEITASDSVAFSHSLNRITGTNGDGKTGSMWFRATLGFRKIAGAWKIAHEHESVPFHMDSGKAANDLQP